MKNGSPELSQARDNLIYALREDNILKSQSIEDAIRSVPRENFLWSKDQHAVAYEDEPIALGDTGQTISAPHMIVAMLEELELATSLKILEVGCGSGYNAALMGRIVSGRNYEAHLVTSIERDPNLVDFARRNLRALSLDNVVRVVEGDGSLGYPQESGDEMYDRIIVTAGAPHIPIFLKKQLKPGGIMLIPVGPISSQTLVKLMKAVDDVGDKQFIQEDLMGCAFVPLVGSDAYYF